MTSQDNTSKAIRDISKRPNTRSRLRKTQPSKDMPPFEEQLERDFLNCFYSTRRIVNMIELTVTKQQKVLKIRKEKKEMKSTQKVLKGTSKEAMVVGTTSLKFDSKEKKEEQCQDEGQKRRPTLKERQEKVYPFPDFDLPDMLE
ncbi:retrotransposon protein putative ty3-gypsy sub-class [Cucumis melo var. makuwa]|uniref:Retrotransposon protein putative ty3-gypsy sub-class n=1 Tax=Cucumis melo var. makuwa TaxID=1194695 RepID=A0A5D3BQ67_CUCMM|nr:retrotransposon protein putative ty3-gypsy sub-class [Cucumis melo var. makuwa]TYK01911.1 retrotransposon protein putative ty3-gypsy sub-class [Cucumis melo var. makuwa]